jgi:Ca2+-binding RTX toxin-like protein
VNANIIPSVGRTTATAQTQPSRIARCGQAVAVCAITAALAAMLAPGAQAATSVVANPELRTLNVTAAVDKANVITVDQPGRFVINDTGDTVSPGSGCTPINDHTVSCSTAEIKTISVVSGNLDDRILYKAGGPGGALSGGDGDDDIRLSGSAPSTDLSGGAGDDTLFGAAGHDEFDGGAGADVFTGGAGIDSVSYRARTTAVIADIDDVADDGTAGEGDKIRLDIENLFGGSANDSLTGSSAANRILGRDGNDTLNGLGDDDELLGEGDNDNLNGGDGNDTATYGNGVNPVDGVNRVDGRDSFSGGAGRDTASYRLHAPTVNVSPDGVPNDGVLGEGDNNLSDVENIQGTGGNDTLTGNNSANSLLGLGGSDTLSTFDRIANDEADGGSGVDRCITDIGDTRPNCET